MVFLGRMRIGKRIKERILEILIIGRRGGEVFREGVFFYRDIIEKYKEIKKE